MNMPPYSWCVTESSRVLVPGVGNKYVLQVQGGWKLDGVEWTEVRVDSTYWPLDMLSVLSAIDAAICNQRCCCL
jgi:hypothetical protein